MRREGILESLEGPTGKLQDTPKPAEGYVSIVSERIILHKMKENVTKKEILKKKKQNNKN